MGIGELIGYWNSIWSEESFPFLARHVSDNVGVSHVPRGVQQDHSYQGRNRQW